MLGCYLTLLYLHFRVVLSIVAIYVCLDHWLYFRLLDVISKLNLQKTSVIRHMTSVIQPILEKGIVDHSIIHRVLMEYLTIADKVNCTFFFMCHMFLKKILRIVLFSKLSLFADFCSRGSPTTIRSTSCTNDSYKGWI